MRAWWVVSVLGCLVGCAPHTSGGDAGGPACPATAPSAGAACSRSLHCVYAHCDAEGVVDATCIDADGGASTWAVATTPCGACNGSACTGGAVCASRSAGAMITSCTTTTCGAGPLDCDCACGVGVPCSISAYSGTGPVFDCQPGCGASICP